MDFPSLFFCLDWDPLVYPVKFQFLRQGVKGLLVWGCFLRRSSSSARHVAGIQTPWRYACRHGYARASYDVI